MARIGFTKITPIKSLEDKTITINGEQVVIKQYLPIAEKALLVSDVLADVLDEHGMNSNLRETIYTALYIIKYYTNINLTEAMFNTAGKTYDLLKLNHIIDQVIQNIPVEEYEEIAKAIRESLLIVSTYRTSLAGMFYDMQAGDQASVKSADELMNQLNEVSQNGFLREVLEKMG